MNYLLMLLQLFLLLSLLLLLSPQVLTRECVTPDGSGMTVSF
ncbi:MAG: hypothetical protein ACI8RD_003517, partial [Bacillariaceae sp.]